MDASTKILLGCVVIFVAFFILALLSGFISDWISDTLSYVADCIRKMLHRAKIKISCENGNHDWNGCTCQRCGKVRNEAHKYSRMTYYGAAVSCHICGKVCNHRSPEGHSLWVSGCKCSECGNDLHQLEIDDEWWDDDRNLYKIRSHCTCCGFRYYQ